MDDIGLLEREAANTPMHGVWGKGGPVFPNYPIAP
jgi:hypothetical protein